jgi:alkanesulfonate monooxygenase SsuD/methylene tetrahydromethanopterin reductase-like flavin-dependent oxidoreductase (luciferase family)
MEFWHFSETAYPFLPPAETYESIRVQLPTSLMDPDQAAGLWDRYLREWQLADEAGLNVMMNEHHQTATCMDPAAPVVAGVLARTTKNARILILGNPIANRKDPVRVAEEMALVDLLSKGRLEIGFVRGVPYEVSAVNSKPVMMSERMWEAHDLILKALTTHDGPFNWEGRFFQQRHVNIWPRAYQQPHPPMWVTAMTAPSAGKIADHGHVVATFLTGLEGTRKVFDAYRARYAELGRPAPADDRLAYAALVYTGRTDEDGLAGAEKLMWYVKANKVPFHHVQPPGYTPYFVRASGLRGERSAYDFQSMTLQDMIDNGIVFAGSPDTVREQVENFYRRVGGFGHLLLMGQAGFLDHDETVRGIETFASEVKPKLAGLAAAGSSR